MTRAMKDSGIPWVGKVPSDWEVTRLGFAVRKIVRKFDKADPPLICSNKGKVVFRAQDTLGQTSDREDGFQGVQPGDLCIHGMDTWHGAIAVSDISGKCTTVVHVCRSERNEVRFVSFYLQALAFFNVYKAFSNGVRQNTSDFRSWKAASRIPVLLPPLPEQKRMAAYLDKVTGSIDGLREKIAREIERLGDYKKTVITEAVCHGIDTSAKMKDSGIPWVGKVPNDWEVKRIGACFKELNTLNHDGRIKCALKFKYGTIIPKSDFDSDNDAYVASTILKYTVVQRGDIIVNGLNLNFDFKSLRVAEVQQSGVITSAYIAMRIFIDNLLPSYANYLFKSYDYKKAFHNMGTGVRKILTFTELGKQKILLPPLAEQKRIAAYLDKVTEKVDEVVAKRKAELERLEAAKRSIICECVTGKRVVSR